MFFIIYKTTNTVNGKFYLGMHQTRDLEDGYLGSGSLLKSALNKYGAQAFVREILHFCDDFESMSLLEGTLVDEKLVSDPRCYNIALGGKGSFSHLNDGSSSHLERARAAARLGGPAAVAARVRKAENDPAYAQRLSEAISKGRKGKPGVHSFAGKSHTTESKARISANARRAYGSANSNFGKVWFTDGNDNRLIYKDEIDSYERSGWYRGRSL